MDLSPFYFNTQPLDESLSDEEIKTLLKNSSEKKYASRSSIFEEGTFPKGVFILKKGRVKIFQRASSGAIQIIAVHGAGEIFGYRPIFNNDRYPVSAETLDPSTIVFIPKNDFVEVLASSTTLSNVLLRYLSREFTVWVNTISIFSRTTVKERLLLNLLLLAERYREPKKWPIKITLSKTDLACLIGTSNETLARMLKLLKDEKVVVSRGRSIEISGPEQLRKIERDVSLFI